MEILNYTSVNETVYKYTHKSGLKVFMAKKPGFSKSAAYLATHFGSINNTFIPFGETEKITVPDGIAHFLEHKMFEMPDNSNVFDEFGKFGANANAFTSFNMTSYYFWCTQNFKENLKTLINFVQTPHFTPENVEKEQGIIGQEIRMYDDDPGWNCFFNMLCGLYKNHPISIDIAGTKESIAEITDKTLYTCYNTYYHPSNMTLCLAGDFDVHDMKNYIDTIAAPLEAQPPVQNFMPEEPAETAQKLVVKNMSVAQPLYSIGFKYTNPTLSAKTTLAAKIALNMFIGKTSDLYNKLYLEGLITPNFGFDYECDSTYAFSSISDEGIDGEVIAKHIVDALKDFEAKEEDFNLAKRKLFGQSLHKFDDPEDYALEMSRSYTIGEDMFEIYDAFNTITLDDVKEIFKSHLTENNMAVSIVK